MSRSLVFRRQVEGDVLQAYAWYEQRREGLGNEFIEELERSYEDLLRYPLANREVADGVRRANLHRFPYRVLYHIETHRIVVLGVFHSSRDDEVWRARIRTRD